MVLRAVVLPEPLVPSSTRAWPSGTATVNPSRAAGPAESNRLRTSVSATTGGVAGASGKREVAWSSPCVGLQVLEQLRLGGQDEPRLVVHRRVEGLHRLGELV